MHWYQELRNLFPGKSLFVLGIFLDIRGAFDYASLDAILGALRGVGVVEVSILNLISSLLHQREVIATWNGAKC